MSKILQINIIIVEVYLWWLSFWFIQRVVIIHWSHLKGTLKVSTRQHALLSCIFFYCLQTKLTRYFTFIARVRISFIFMQPSIVGAKFLFIQGGD